MRTHQPTRYALIATLALLTAACGGGASPEELARLERENEQLRARLEGKNPQAPGQVSTPSSVLEHFANDLTHGTLAGLVPGDSLAQARAGFGPESRTRSWRSEGRRIYQYEWDLEAGVSIRLNADGREKLQKVAVVFADPAGVHIPTLGGLTLGQETYGSILQRFGATLKADPQLWGARGLYTVAQRTPFPNTGWRLEFVYEMPVGMSRAHLERIGEELLRARNPSLLEPQLGDRAPFLVALEESP